MTGRNVHIELFPQDTLALPDNYKKGDIYLALVFNLHSTLDSVRHMSFARSTQPFAHDASYEGMPSPLLHIKPGHQLYKGQELYRHTQSLEGAGAYFGWIRPPPIHHALTGLEKRLDKLATDAQISFETGFQDAVLGYHKLDVAYFEVSHQRDERLKHLYGIFNELKGAVEKDPELTFTSDKQKVLILIAAMHFARQAELIANSKNKAKTAYALEQEFLNYFQKEL